MAKRDEGKLTPQQARFVAEYLVHLNGKRAAISAGYSEKTAAEQASRLLTIVKVAKAVERGQAEREERLRMTGDDVLREYWRLANLDTAEAFKEDGTFKDIHLIPVDLRRAISSVEVEETFEGTGEERVWTGYLRKVKFWSKDNALNMLGKHHGLFTDKVQLTGNLQHQHSAEADLTDFTDEELATLEAIYRARDERRRAAAHAGGNPGGAGAAPASA